MPLTKIEADLQVERLLDKHRAWLRQQPEWATLIGATDRKTRRRVADAIAHDLTTIPASPLAEDGLNRGTRRKVLKELERREKYWEGLT